MSKHLIVTIARRYGSGGREIGEKVAALLGIKCYDRELITMAAARGNLSEDALARADEVAAGSLLYTLAMGSTSYGMHAAPHGYRMPINDKLFYLQSDIIRELAEQEDCVFVGRCADYVLREEPCVLRVFVYGDEEKRIARIMSQHDLPRNKAIDLMNKTDHRRASYYNFYTGQKWGKHENYSLAIDAYTLGMDGTAKMIADFALALKYQKEKEN